MPGASSIDPDAEDKKVSSFVQPRAFGLGRIRWRHFVIFLIGALQWSHEACRQGDLLVPYPQAFVYQMSSYQYK
ncbi:hypothetical protein V6N11_081258 [Hibiscus sabdariffa]|uniref:Uncharacterized protein n=1 Tax=Hibiscus sabdariffa TaxID=183260 RepID=A0ABR2QJV2_9ROSI